MNLSQSQFLGPPHHYSQVRFGTRTDAASALALCRRLRTELLEDYPAEVMLQKSAIIRQLLRTGAWIRSVVVVIAAMFALFVFNNRSS